MDVSLGYQINRSFQFVAGLSGGTTQRISTVRAGTGIDDINNSSVEAKEVSALFTLFWAPPTRATKETVAQLRQVLR